MFIFKNKNNFFFESLALSIKFCPRIQAGPAYGGPNSRLPWPVLTIRLLLPCIGQVHDMLLRYYNCSFFRLQEYSDDFSNASIQCSRKGMRNPHQCSTSCLKCPLAFLPVRNTYGWLQPYIRARK